MSDLVRFGVAMDRALLGDFDRRIAARGYENRSEALRDLIRADLTRAGWDGGAQVAATLTLVYGAQVRDLVARLTELEQPYAGNVVSSLRVPLEVPRRGDARDGRDGRDGGGPGRWLEVFVLRGAAAELTALANRLGGAKGVLSCELTLASVVSPDGASAEGRGARGLAGARATSSEDGR